MGSSKLPLGVEVRGDTIRIRFTYKGIRCTPTLKGIKATKSNIKFAEQKRNTVLYEINNGSFDYASHFPSCTKARLFSRESKKVNIDQALDDFLEIKSKTLAPSTFKSYKNKAEMYIRPWGKQLINEFTASDIEFWVETDLHHLSNKAINEILIIARGIFKRAFRDGLIDNNPFVHIDNKPIFKDEPDPFTRDEIDRILSTHSNQPQNINMLQAAIWSGLSISEYFGLAWEDIDTERWVAKVRRVKVDGNWKLPKTPKREREIELIEPAVEALIRQKEHTYLKESITIKVLQRDNKTKVSETITPVFLSSVTNQVHSYSPFIRFFRDHLKKAKVRYRGPNHCRHSFASQMLTLDISKEWIAVQLGHSGTKMIEQHYGKWIKEDAPPMAKIVSNLLKSVPPAAQSKNGTP